MRNKISYIVSSKLPEFVQSNYELFTAFIKYYFEWMETPENYLEYIETFSDNQDFDRADEQYIDMFIQDFAETFPKNFYDDGTFKFTKVELVKSIREFYIAKGSESSIRFIFNLMYNTDIEFFYPRTTLQKSSSCVWDSTNYSYCTAINFSDLNIKFDSDIFAIGVTSGKSMVIDRITTTFFSGTQVMKLFISSNEPGLLVGEDIQLTVDDVTITETLIGLLDSISIIDGGTDYSISDNIEITDTTGDNAFAKITELSSGGFDTYDIQAAGSGYSIGDIVYAAKSVKNTGSGFIAQVKEIGGLGEILKIQIINSGVGYTLAVYAYITSINGVGATIKLNGDEIGKIKSIDVFDSGLGYVDGNTIAVSVTSGGGSGLVVSSKVSAIFTGIFRHITNSDFPSNYSRMQDSYLYQNFSYVIRSSISPDKWVDNLKRVVHPAGTILFGMYSLESYVEAIISMPDIYTQSLSNSISHISESTNQHIAISGYPTHTIYFPQEEQLRVGLLHYDLDNTKLDNSWPASTYFHYTLDGIISRDNQESRQEDVQLDVLFVYNNTTPYTPGQRVLFTDGNVYANLIGSTGIQPPDNINWDIVSFTTYNNLVEYSLNDAVFDGTNKYIYINATPSIGNTPPNATYWNLL